MSKNIRKNNPQKNFLGSSIVPFDTWVYTVHCSTMLCNAIYSSGAWSPEYMLASKTWQAFFFDLLHYLNYYFPHITIIISKSWYDAEQVALSILSFFFVLLFCNFSSGIFYHTFTRRGLLLLGGYYASPIKNLFYLLPRQHSISNITIFLSNTVLYNV